MQYMLSGADGTAATVTVSETGGLTIRRVVIGAARAAELATLVVYDGADDTAPAAVSLSIGDGNLPAGSYEIGATLTSGCTVYNSGVPVTVIYE